MKFVNLHFTIGKFRNFVSHNHLAFLSFSLMPQFVPCLTMEKKHVVTVPVRLRKLQGIETPPKHEG